MTAAALYALYKDTWQGFADVETLAYSDAAGSSATAKGRKCVPEQKELQRLGEDLALQSDYATFVIWDTTLDGVEIQGGGKITWIDGSVWTVQATWTEHFETQWRCLCIKDI